MGQFKHVLLDCWILKINLWVWSTKRENDLELVDEDRYLLEIIDKIIFYIQLRNFWNI